ncbi:uncharacterized protein LOC128993595 [Macrosteles quadrilineatus]|uniref:uncharacterized protein LOC128993595 n=1 Tax=Macrosteles quadrilineatus TaxID=74068 RepID=UPI0023E10EEC|nr:uncharacterized protein LOC128993595 [Macrosteles quadrilineatus]
MRKNTECKLKAQPRVLLHRLETVLGPHMNTNKNQKHDKDVPDVNRIKKEDSTTPLIKEEKLTFKTGIDPKSVKRELDDPCNNLKICDKSILHEPNRSECSPDKYIPRYDKILHQPTVQLLPTIKHENTDIITVKKTQIQEKHLIDLEKEWQVKDTLPTVKIETENVNTKFGGKKCDNSNLISLKNNVDSRVDLLTEKQPSALEKTSEIITNCEQNSEASTLESPTVSEKDSHGTKSAGLLIKVKDAISLGIENTQEKEPAQPIVINPQLQLKPPNENESIIANILRLYPLFFSPTVRSDLYCLVEILDKLSRESLLEHDNQMFDSEKYLWKVQNYSRTFVEAFNKILKLNDPELDIDTWKKVIPMLYLQIDKAFEKLGRKDFDFRTVMKKLFEIQKFVCVHDVMLQKPHKQFKDIVATYYRWLSEIFMECEPLGSGDDVLSTSSEEIEEVGEHSVTEDFNMNVDEQSKENDTSSDFDLDVDYLHCPMCRQRLPRCYLCHELLTCPCQLKINVTAEKHQLTVSALNLCREHGSCGDSWDLWESDWLNQDILDHREEMLLESVCWNRSCNNKVEMLCVCRVRAYCSNICQIEDWREDHFKTCRRETEPECLLADLQLTQEMDVT